MTDMDYLLIEDEHLAAQRLENMVKGLRPGWRCVGKARSVPQAVKLFEDHPEAMLAFMDIHLGDGDSFSIFERIDVSIPLIFTTAYEEYSIRAFKLNSIDYLLKPFSGEDLLAAIEKLEKYGTAGRESWRAKIDKAFPERRKRYLIAVGNKLKTIEIGDILYFFSESKNTFLVTREGLSYPLEKSLDKVEEELDPEAFFRINRKYLVSLQAVVSMYVFGPARLKIELAQCKDKEIVVARERYSQFRDWLDK